MCEIYRAGKQKKQREIQAQERTIAIEIPMELAEKLTMFQICQHHKQQPRKNHGEVFGDVNDKISNINFDEIVNRNVTKIE